MDNKELDLEFTFNQDYGIIIKSGEEKTFLDLNIFNSQKQVEIFIINHESGL